MIAAPVIASALVGAPATGAPTSDPHAGGARAGAPAVVARDLVKRYPGKVRALDGLGFTVASGTIFGLLGPNGAGKSTAMRILTTLARPDAGEASLGGLDVLRQPAEVRRIIGLVAQRGGADLEATGRENLVLQGRVHGLGGRALASRVDELLQRAGLAAASGRRVSTWSGGMQRKLDLALGLVHRPRVLFLDEPTTGLDPEARAELWSEIGRLAGEEGLTVLLTTHSMEEADRLVRRLAIVDRGRVVAEGTPEELKGALHGDAIQLELEEPDGGGRVREALARVAGVGDVLQEGRSVRARADRGATALPAVLAALESAGLRIASAAVARPTLDDVYFRHAGRAFARADQGGGR